MVARFLLALALACPFWALGQAFNGTFEPLQPNGIPTGWSIAQGGGSATTLESHLGKRAAKAWVHEGYQAGIWLSNTSGNEGNAAELTGYYKYLGDKKQCEKASMTYLLGAKAVDGRIDTMAWGETELKLNKDFEKFLVPISAMGSGEPDFMSIQFKPSGHCHPDRKSVV